MSYSYTQYSAPGGVKTFTVPFSYVRKSDVIVKVNGLVVSFSWPTDQTVSLTDTPDEGDSVTITRATDIEPYIVDFVDGSNLTELELDKSIRQSLYGLQDLSDKVDDWIVAIQGGTMNGNSLPIVTSGNDDSFVCVVDGSWDIVTPNQVLAILGLNNTTLALPTPAGEAGLIFTDGSPVWMLKNGHYIKNWLGLGDLAFSNEADFANLGLNDVVTAPSGVLPALNGANLTNLPGMNYAWFVEQVNLGTDGGKYVTTNGWQKRAINTTVANDISAVLDDTNNNVQLQAGRYWVQARSAIRLQGHAWLKLVDTDGNDIVVGPAIYCGSGQQVEATLSREITVASAKTLYLKIASDGTGNANNYELGTTATGGSVPGGVTKNYYSSLEIWKLP